MIGQYRVTALIPARGGSKRLPRKNVKLLVDKPLIAWSIEVAKASKYIDRVVVSTDDEEIKQVSEQYGAEVPFLRPEHLSNDHASSFDVIKHAIGFLKLDQPNELIVLLQPTSPLRLVSELDTALEFFIAKMLKVLFRFLKLSIVQCGQIHCQKMVVCLILFVQKCRANEVRIYLSFSV
jgi:N-acylneuraminate cytidylyltransferase